MFSPSLSSIGAVSRRLLASLLLVALPTVAAAQEIITLRAGAGGRMMVSVGSKVMIPVVIDMSAAGAAATVGSLQSGLSWGASRLTLDSIRAAGFGSLTQNTANAATGSATISTFDVTGAGSTVTMANLYFSASSSGSTTLGLTPTVAGSATGGVNILSAIRIRDLDVCVAPGSKWGDVNGDTLVNIIDAQQIARYGVGLSVANAALLMVQGDVTNDGSVNVIDAQQIARFSVGLSTSARTNTLAFTPPVVTTLTVPSALDATSGSVNPGVPATLSALVSAKQAQLRPLAKDASNQDVTSCATIIYSSDAPSIATVSSSGLVSSLAPGTATITVTSGAASAAVEVTVTALLGLTREPAGAESGVVFSTQPVVAIRDALGATLTSATDSVRVTKASGTGTLSGTTTVAAVAGVATFTDLQIAGDGAHTLLFGATGLASATSSTFATSQTPTTLAVLTQPAGAADGAPFSTQPVVRVLDRAGLTVVGNTAVVTASIASGGGVLGGTTAVAAVNGVATFADLKVSGAGAHTLSFAVTGVASATSSSFVVLQVPTALALSSQPAGAVSGVPFTTQPVVLVRDLAGLTVTDNSALVTAAIASGGGILSGTITVTAVNGVATFTNLKIAGAGAHSLSFTASGLAAVASGTFTLTQTVAALAITTQPGGGMTAAVWAVQPVVRVLDVAGLTVAGNASEVTAAIATGSGTLSGTTTVAAINGVATFTDLKFTSATGGAVTLTFTAAGATSVTSSSFGIIAGSLRMATQPAGATSSEFFTTQPVVEILDDAGARRTTATAAVTVSIVSGSGTLNGTLTVNAVNGVATFTDLSISGGGAHTLAFAATWQTGVSSGSFTVATPTGYRLLVGRSPSQTVTNNVNVVIPLIADVPAGGNLAAITMTVRWDPTKFTYKSNTSAGFGSLTPNLANAASGTIVFSIFDAAGTTTSVTLLNLTLAPINLTGSDITGTVTATVSVASDEPGTSVTVVPRNLQVTINP